MIRPVIASALLLGSTPSFGQPVPEGIHRDVDGPPHLCDMTAATVPSLETAIAARFASLPTDERFVSYEDPAHRRIWTFTTAVHPAHPSVSCITVEIQGNQVGLRRQIHCMASRAACDVLYREFEALDAANRQRFQSR